MDQFYIDGERSQAKKPFELLFFKQNRITISKIAVGGIHTLILSSQGHVFSFGCNDDGALGRTSGEESQPGLVELPYLVDQISAGDSHSCAANSRNGILFQWGKFRDNQGNMDKDQQFSSTLPQIIGRDRLKGRQIKKLISGDNHALLLDDQKLLYAWGNSETFVIGRKPTERHRLQQSLKFDSI